MLSQLTSSIAAASRPSRRGSVLITVVIFSAVSLILVGSLLNYSLSERRMNTRHAARLEARNAAEALAEFGAAQIRQKYETRGTFTLNPNGTDALRQPPTTFWTGSSVIPTTSDLTSSHYPPATSTDLELIGGTERRVTTGSGDLYFVDPNDPNNDYDTLRGKWITRRDVSVIARATVRPAGGGPPITAYSSQRISVRGAPLFAHAIFYNMDLEIYNGPVMNISGPVHTNGNLYLFPDAELNFRGNVSSTGKIYHYGKPGDAADGAGGHLRNGKVTFLNRSGTLVNLFGKDLANPTTDFWRDSTKGLGPTATSYGNFAANASQVWNGYLQTGEHGIQNYTPVAIGKYVEDPTPSDGVDQSVNTGRLIIEPSNPPVYTDPDYDAKMEIEKQKYANMAGLCITVTPGTGAITLSSRGIASNGTIKTEKTLTLPSNGKLVTFKPYTETGVRKDTVTTFGAMESKTSKGTTYYRYPKLTAQNTINLAVTSAGTTETLAAAGTPTPTGSYTDWRTTTTPPVVAPVTGTATYTYGTGMYDRHRSKALDLVELDIDALRDAVSEMQKGTAADPAKAIGNFTPDDWSGVVYVDVQGGPTTVGVGTDAGTTVAASNALNTNTSVRIINGAGKVPTYGTVNPGLTIASNAPVYILGHLNADGSATKTTTYDPSTDPETGELPCAVVADAITVLSPGFNDSTSKTTMAAASGDVEVSAALLQGIAPSNKNGNGRTSGGAHNIVRFLENWGGKTTWFRGSLVCLFESRVFTEPHGITSYYSPPNRNWGFNKLFAGGTYPPGTPRVLSYRRVDFTELTSSEYAALRDSFNWK